MGSLATIASIAPLVGVAGTILGILNNFPGFDGEKSAILAMTEGLLSDSLVPTAFGLAVALFAYCGYKYWLNRLEALDVEMEAASLQLANELSRLRQAPFFQA